jgi:predicted N-formylglutamate amidohydrolase
MSVLISCEVGGQSVPSQWPALRIINDRDNNDRAGNDRVTLSKRSNQSGRRSKKPSSGKAPVGPDTTAKYVAERMADYLRAPLISNDYASELVDVRRSLHHRQLFSKTTRNWSAGDRQQLIDTIYTPYRNRLRTKLGKMLSRSQYVIHLSVESFPLKPSPLTSPVTSSPKKSTSGKGKNIRRADMGLLYDPAAADEVDLCLDWIDEMYDEIEMLRVRRNYPQRGTRDSITKAMRSEFAGQNYIGIEMMVNQAWAGREIAIRDEVIDGICWTLETVLEIPQSQAA